MSDEDRNVISSPAKSKKQDEKNPTHPTTPLVEDPKEVRVDQRFLFSRKCEDVISDPTIVPSEDGVGTYAHVSAESIVQKEGSAVELIAADSIGFKVDKSEDSTEDSTTPPEDDTTSTHISEGKASKAAIDPPRLAEFTLGMQVYVEYRRIFYSSTIEKWRKKKTATEYLVHYEGYKKASNRWVKAHSLHEVNEVTKKRFDEQRFGAPVSYDHMGQPVYDESQAVPRRSSSRNSVACGTRPISRRSSDPPGDSERSESSLDDVEPGVAFLPGSCVFVEWSGALYLAKMLKRRFSGVRSEYFLSYDGFKNHHDAWVSIHNIYEVNPQTKRIFSKKNSEILRNSEEGPGGSSCKRKDQRKKKEEDGPSQSSKANKRKRDSSRKKKEAKAKAAAVAEEASEPSSSSNNYSASFRANMLGIQPGVEFLPGSTLFAEYKDGGLYLGKMLKRRGKGDYMEYFIQYNGFSEDQKAWVSISLVFEINPQTKRLYREMNKGKKL